MTQSRLAKISIRSFAVMDALDRALAIVNDDLAEGHLSPREHLKTQRWVQDISYMQAQLRSIDATLRPHIESEIGQPLDPDLLATSLFQPSTKNVFSEMRVHYASQEGYGALLTDLELLSELAKELALLGDAAISLVALHYLWSDSLQGVGRLTQRRANLVSNETLAQLCDAWGLYKYRIHFDPPTTSRSEIEHIKGSLVEAVSGAAYVNSDFDGIAAIVALLDRRVSSQSGRTQA
ncbi:MAG: hypothetical protein HXY34_04205 [Candidatus Thorarchaeota archaeon]|nr:hypothetical protein [Candidatus Thorarchaeota archaeon]